jgi:HAD superfamily hydrolase (TIGR01509 family)
MTDENRAVLFDMDGVIVDSEVYWKEFEDERILPRVLGESGERPAEGETTGMNFREIYAHLEANYDVQVDEEEFVDLYDRTAREIYTEHASLMPGFRELCTDLRAAGVTVAVVSSSPHEWIEIVRERFDLAFDTVVSTEDVDGPGKPEPDVYEYAAGRIGVSPGDCTVVEDSQHGTRAAARAGTKVIGYRGEANADLSLPAAVTVVSGPEELRAELHRRLDIEH